jgi:phi13 family phage major tail protein
MATIGLDSLFYAPITESEGDVETYGTPLKLAKAISTELSVELAEAILYADDAASEVVKSFKNGTLTLGIDDIGKASAMALLGVRTDANGVIISSGEDTALPVAIGFRARKSNGKYRYFWLYRTIFGVPSTSLQTKGDSIEFQTPTIEGIVTVRNKLDWQNKHPWKTEVTEGDEGVNPDVIAHWFDSVYEPAGLQITVTLNPGDGTVDPTSINVSEGGTYGTLPTPVYESHTFLGWFTQSTGGNEITSESTVDTEVTTLYAHWSS